MSFTVIFINIFALICLGFAFIKDRKKTKQSLIVAVKSFFRILPTVFIIVIIIGFLLSFIPSGEISKISGEQSGFTGVLIVALLGSLLYIPSLVAFPLGASLLQSGASVMVVATFITTLTMVGIVTLPLEIKELGKKIALLRNGISFAMALIIALVIGVAL